MITEEHEPLSRLASFAEPLHVLVLGASGGIGLACTRELLAISPTTRVFATSRDGDRQRGLAEVSEEHPGRIEALRLDLLDDASIERACSDLRARTDSLHLILGCTGLLHGEDLQPEKRLAQLSSQAMAEAFRVNTTGPLIVLQQLLGLLPRGARSVIAMLSARVGSIGDNRLGGWYSYRASKAALNMAVRTLAIELGRTHPECVCAVLHPGTVETALSKPFTGGVPEQKLFSTERAADRILRVIDGLQPPDSGGFFAWDGQPIPW